MDIEDVAIPIPCNRRAELELSPAMERRASKPSAPDLGVVYGSSGAVYHLYNLSGVLIGSTIYRGVTGDEIPHISNPASRAEKPHSPNQME